MGDAWSAVEEGGDKPPPRLEIIRVAEVDEVVLSMLVNKRDPAPSCLTILALL
ncbi:hypothetical protein [Sinorhizobium fredii]|uniref:hypothetical protein n=1 Tax=Rhizobium fredii TaxID=380 RepID=UPI0004AD822F|nr:hypothetical protein [Sinorhizobium fredii]AWI58301.1 hypothetical protein AB395_00002650 [Sinorhizobium fredii CCBAU 45436]